MWWGPWRGLGPVSGKGNEGADILIRRWKNLGGCNLQYLAVKTEVILRQEINLSSKLIFNTELLDWLGTKLEEDVLTGSLLNYTCSPTLPQFVWSEEHAAELLSARDREHTHTLLPPTATQRLRETVVLTSCLWLLVFTMSIRHLLHVIQNIHTQRLWKNLATHVHKNTLLKHKHRLLKFEFVKKKKKNDCKYTY